MPRKRIYIGLGIVLLIILAALGYYVWGIASHSAKAPSTAAEGSMQPATDTAKPRFALIDRDAILQNSEVGQDVSRQVGAYAEQVKKDLSGRKKALEEEDRQLRKQAAGLSPDVRSKREAALQAKETAFTNEVQSKDAQIQTALQDANSAISKTLGPILRQVAKAHGANLVLDKRAVVAANATTFDITPDVIKELNAKMQSYKVTLPPPSAH